MKVRREPRFLHVMAHTVSWKLDHSLKKCITLPFEKYVNFQMVFALINRNIKSPTIQESVPTIFLIRNKMSDIILGTDCEPLVGNPATAMEVKTFLSLQTMLRCRIYSFSCINMCRYRPTAIYFLEKLFKQQLVYCESYIGIFSLVLVP